MTRRFSVVVLSLLIAATTCLTACGQSEPHITGLVPRGTVLLAFTAPAGFLRLGIHCSGTVVGDYVLTAAHCVTEEPLVAVSNTADICTAAVTPVALGRPVPSPPEVTDSDLALISLDRSIENLSRPTHADPDTYLMSGWGARLSDARPCTPRTLTVVSQPSACQPSNGSTLCGASQESGSCGGDSGAGLIDERGLVIGVASDGVGCDAGVGTRFSLLQAHSDWLMQQGLLLEDGVVGGSR